MTTAQERKAVHGAELAAPPLRGYRLVADVTQWPLIFPPCLAVQVLERTPGAERVRLWALANDEVRTWTSVRELDPERLRVAFRQDVTSPPVTSMSGRWSFTAVPREPLRSRLVLEHESTVAGPPQVDEHIAALLDRNSRAEVDAIRVWTERAEPPEELIFSFSDQILIEGEPHDVYAFLYQADRWPERLDHVARLELRTEPQALAGAEVQRMEMDTVGADGVTHHSSSVRLCFPHTHIVYKQTAPPPGLLGHTGEWLITPTDVGCLVIAVHHVALDPAAGSAFADPDSGLAQARRTARQRLGANSMRTLERARGYVEGRRPGTAERSA
ncbi:aromatase/cyclase [Dactylosporangium roseum]|uniref:Aromatase/cyclase n=1 Tax=Dactylosporangium roseum TaxID=47989 RepID=A0ABY5ZB84_9ACTN|nr:aromatase/cyclase [Dactylosporangium roseum]UWZ39366.1 aromatase/cyclase [Dactylosporangium roseum]